MKKIIVYKQVYLWKCSYLEFYCSGSRCNLTNFSFLVIVSFCSGFFCFSDVDYFCFSHQLKCLEIPLYSCSRRTIKWVLSKPNDICSNRHWRINNCCFFNLILLIILSKTGRFQILFINVKIVDEEKNSLGLITKKRIVISNMRALKTLAYWKCEFDQIILIL